MRPRKKDKHLPPCVFLKHGAYWYVKGGKWKRLGAELHAALEEYARIHKIKSGGMAELIESALPFICQGKAVSTAKKYRGTATFLQEVLKNYTPHTVTQRTVVAIRRELVSQSSVCNRTISVLRQVFDYALEEGIVESNPCVGIKSVPPNKRQRLMTFDEFFAIREKAGPILQIVMDLCYLTGQRISDVLKMQRSDLNETGIFVAQQKGRGRIRMLIAWNHDLRAATEAALALHGKVPSLYLLPGYRPGRPPSYNTIWAQYKKAREAAGVPDVVIHDMRAQSGTEAEEQGIDPQKLLGHTNPEMTKRYLRAKKVPIVEGPTFRQSKTDDKKAQ